ncbi:acetylcholinesterase-1-like [Ornithodoros turicata]|uniref:acetylcholinesterase-1-like n=1 Tax=Ornithodoros turicata TaxID=34597 RepID=UPI00313A45AF
MQGRRALETSSTPGPDEGCRISKVLLATAMCTVLIVYSVVVAVLMARNPLGGALLPDDNKRVCAAEPLGIKLTSGFLLGHIIDVQEPQTPNVRAFLGVPFAQSTAGENRFRKPRPLDAVPGGHMNATTHGPPCSQPVLEGQTSVTSEDCLHMAIWTPGVCSQQDPLRPVLVLLQSEWFETGSNSAPESDGAYLSATGDIVVVAPNHRLGPFGFLNVKGTDANVALHDVLLALAWIRDNIASFHGNPDNITLLALDSGSIIATELLLNADALTPFARRFVLLGLAATTWLPSNSFEKGNENFMRLVEASGCRSSTVDEALACLRRVPAQKITEAAQKTRPPLRFVPSHGAELLNKGGVKRERIYDALQVLAGNTARDADSLFSGYGVASLASSNFSRTLLEPIIASERYLNLLQLTTVSAQDAAKLIDRLISMFDLPVDPSSPIDVFELERVYNFQTSGGAGIRDMASDLLYVCPMLSLLRLLRDRRADVFHYVLNDGNYGGRTRSPKDPASYHQVLLSGMPFKYQDKAYLQDASNKLISVVAAFVKDGAPSLLDNIRWPQYGNSSISVLLDSRPHSSVVRNWRSSQCHTISQVFGRV